MGLVEGGAGALDFGQDCSAFRLPCLGPRLGVALDDALSVGTVVPASVRIVDVDPAFVEIFPQFRGHKFFVVRDDIVIIDKSRKVVSVVPVGSSAQGGAQLDTDRSAAHMGSGGGVLNLSSDQIRQVQMMLIQRGFDIDDADGVLDQRTIQAVITFQRQHGFQATGQIDNETVSALGLSNLSEQHGGATKSTTGQGGAAAQPPADQNIGAGQQGNQDGNRPSKASQGGEKMQQSPANQNQPSTTGQGGEKMQQSPANQKPGAGEDNTSNRPVNKGSNSERGRSESGGR